MASELEKAVNALVRQAPGWKQFLEARPEVTPIPAQRGVGRAQAAQGGSGPAGQAAMTLTGPLTVTSSDGLFVWQYEHSVSIVLDGVTYKLPVVG